ncbi:MAG: hypothetical protein ACHQ9S_18050 [Candidatus Binatia bacterium]
MSNLARISYPGGALIIPLESPDDGELIHELVDYYGEVELALGGVLARIHLPKGPNTPGCMLCCQRLHRLVCVLQARNLCLRCFKAAADSKRLGRAFKELRSPGRTLQQNREEYPQQCPES